MEKVITGLECCKDIHTAGAGYAQGCINCPYKETASDGMGGYACIRKLFNDAISLSKAHEPMEPVVTSLTYFYGYRSNYFCGECGAILSNGQKYCSECGRAVKWE